MRTLVPVTTVILALSLSLGATAVGAPPDPDPVAGQGKAHGNVDSETVGMFLADTKFDAEQKKDGKEKGKVHRKVYDPATGETVRDFEGKVTCYYQEGNLARFSGIITKRKGTDDIPGDYFFFAVEDNGSGKNAPPDRIGAGRFMTEQDCSLPLVSPIRDVEKGNIHVHPMKN